MIHTELKKIAWYKKWHSHPRHQHAHWFGLFVFLMLASSIIASQFTLLFFEKNQASAQASLPAPNHQIMLGYYFTISQFGNFLSEVSSYNNTQIILAGSWIRSSPDCMRDTAGLESAFASAIVANQRIIYGPMAPGSTPSCPDGQNEYDIAMNVARNHWNNIDVLYLADEPSMTQAETESFITNYKNAIAASGLSSKPTMINYTLPQIMTGNSFRATNLDIVSFEAYADSSRQNEANLATNLLNEVNQAKGLIGNRQMMIVVQGYGRNYCPPGGTVLCWSNLESLKSIQATGYLASANDPNVIGLTIFSYGRSSGTKDLIQNRGGQCIQIEHQRIWGAISGATQPAPVSCGGVVVTPNPTGPPAVDTTPGWEGGLAYNPVANNWLIVSSPRDINVYGRIMSDTAQPLGNFFKININGATETQVLAPKVAYDTDMNRYLVIWVDFATDVNGTIYGQFVAQDGNLIGNNFLIPRDFSGAIFLNNHSPMIYDDVNHKFVYAWETRDPQIHSNMRTLNEDGTANPTIRVTDEIDVFQTVPVVAYSPTNNEYCIAYSYWGPNATSTQQRSNLGVRAVDAASGLLGPVSFGNDETWGSAYIVYDSADNTYLLTFNNGLDTKGAIMSSCDTATLGPSFMIGNFQTVNTTYNAGSNAFASVGQAWDSFSNPFVIFDSRGNNLQNLMLFTDNPPGTHGNYAPAIGANNINGTFGVTSARNLAITRFISPLGAGVTVTSVTPTPTPLLSPCDPSTITAGVPLICDFQPTFVLPGDTVRVSGANLSGSVHLRSSDNNVIDVSGTIDADGILSFIVPPDALEGEYTITVEAATSSDSATTTEVLTITNNLPPDPFPDISPLLPTADGIFLPQSVGFGDLVGNIFTYSIGLVGLAVFIMILYAGFLWLTSGANPGNISTAKRMMSNALLGALLLISSYVILYTVNPELVGGDIDLPQISLRGRGGSQSIIIQPTCDAGVCSNNSSRTCSLDKDCNVVCINSICNNNVPGTCTLDIDCQPTPRFITESESQAATAFSMGCSKVIGVGFQDFSSVTCPSLSAPFDLDPLFAIQDVAANQQIKADIVQTSGNTGQGRKIVILDTGYNTNHPELSSSFIGGWDFVNNDNDPTDDNAGGAGSPGHGSHVAGIITGDGTDPRAKGVAPGAQIIAGKVLDGAGRGNFSNIVTAIYWAINGPDGIFGTSDDFRPDAINISIGGGSFGNICDNNDGTSQEISKAIQYAHDHGTVVVVAAGNLGGSGVSLPGCIDSAFTVGAIQGNDTIATFSGKGAGVDIVAPGANIYSSLLGSNYGQKSGTSMATPVISGVVALVKSAFPNFTASQVEQAITSTATDLGTTGKDTSYGWGKVNASNATGGSSACSGICGNIVPRPASCTLGATGSNPTCNITLDYATSGVAPASLVIRKNGIDWNNLSGANGSVSESSPASGIYTYTISNRSDNTVVSRATVEIYQQGTLTSNWLTCKKNENSANPSCNVTLTYSLVGATTGSIYKDGARWQSLTAASGTISDNNPSTGTHTYTLRDNSGTTQSSRAVVRIEPATAKFRNITSLSASSTRAGSTITINGDNLGNALELSRRYLTVQIHDKNRNRCTTIGDLDTTNKIGTWIVNVCGFGPGQYTLRVGPNLDPNEVSNEVNLTITP